MRRPHEKAKKTYEAGKRGALDPREHFLSQSEITRRLHDIITYINHEPMEGEVFRGVPAQLWAKGVAENPLLTMPEESKWLYRRDWVKARITSGWARIRLTDPQTGYRYSLFYSNPEAFAPREGQEIVVYYDRENFEAPAQIIDRDGNYLCTAQYFDRKGSFLDGDRTGHDIRLAWKNAVMSGYATTVAHAPSRQVPAEVAARRALRPGGHSASRLDVGTDGMAAPRTAPAARTAPAFEAPARSIAPESPHRREVDEAAEEARIAQLEARERMRGDLIPVFPD
jgi:hypothetical protein